jgi:hypothetical protein
MAIQTRNNLEESELALAAAIANWNSENPDFVLVLTHGGKASSVYRDIATLANPNEKESIRLNDFGRKYQSGFGHRLRVYESAENFVKKIGSDLRFEANLKETLASRRDEAAKAREAHRLDVAQAVETIREMGIRSDDLAKLNFLKELGASAFVIKVVFFNGIEVKVPGTNVREAALQAKKVVEGYLA